VTPPDAALPPTIALRCRGKASSRGPQWPPGDIALARALFTVWAARGGRVLCAVPFTDLTADKLIEFWADAQLDYPTVTSIDRGRL
jgi:hypothetical protein